MPGFLDHYVIPAMVPEVLDFWISGFAWVVGTYGPALLKYYGFLDLPRFLVHSATPALVPEILDFWISGFAQVFGT